MAVDWRDSTTYQAIFREGRNKGLIEGRNEGRVSGAQRLLVHLGTKRFGEPDHDDPGCHRGDSGSRADRRSWPIESIDPDVHDWNEWLRTS